MNRWDLINELLGGRGRYLEIGIGGGHCLQHVTTRAERFAVDPSPIGNAAVHATRFFRCTSDVMFEKHGHELGLFDVILIDGLHHAEQVLRDFENALVHLTPNGVILLHDCNPLSEPAQTVPRPKDQNIWNGDCWRTIVQIRQRAYLDCIVLDTDHGLGVVLRRMNTLHLAKVDADVLSYADLDARRSELLRLTPVSDWKAWYTMSAPVQEAASTHALHSGNDIVTVVTAVFGDRDTLSEPPSLHGHRFICFTDRDDVKSTRWEIRKVPKTDRPRLEARRVKLLVHEYVPEADRVVWVDASLRIVGSLKHLFSRNTDLLLVRHPVRRCVYEEMATCAAQGRADAGDLERQAARYRKLGIVEKGGLYACGLLARRMTEEMKSFGRLWWEELTRTTERDQISLIYALRETKISFSTLSVDIYNNAFVKYRQDERGEYGDASSIKQAEPNIVTAIVYDRDMNLGRAYNEFMETLPEGNWAAFLDHDAMFTTREWFGQISEAIRRNPHAGAFTAVTNRIGNREQLAPGVDSDRHDMVYHRQIGQRLLSERGHMVRDITDAALLSGVLIVISKRAWRAIGGFKPGFLGVDNQAHLDLKRAGLKICLIEGLYLYHWYRAQGDDAHVKRLRPEHRWTPR